MRKYFIGSAFLFIWVLGNAQNKPTDEGLSMLYEYVGEEVYHCMEDSLRQVAIDMIQSYQFDTATYYRDCVNQEFFKLASDVLKVEREYDHTCNWMIPIYIKRLERHLADPLTFECDIPSLNNVRTPDGKYRFYSVGHRDGFMTNYINYIQYLDASGRIAFKRWKENQEPGSSQEYREFWMFRHNGTDYYVAKTYKGISTRAYGYGMEIFTLEDGEPTFHTEFYPRGVYTENNRFEAYIMEDGTNIPSGITVCEGYGNSVDYTFDPETKTIHITDDGYIYGSSDQEEEPREIETYWQLIDPDTDEMSFLYEYIGEKNYRRMDDSTKRETISLLRSFHFTAVPYTNLEDIETELNDLYAKLPEMVCEQEQSWIVAVFIKRLEFHLANPLTFEKGLGLDTRTTPDSKYRFYTFQDFSTSESGYTSYIQYRDDSGNVKFKRWETDNRPEPQDKDMDTLWQFRHNGTDYYVAKGYPITHSRYWSSTMEIFTLKDGIPEFHTELYPPEMRQYIIEYLPTGLSLPWTEFTFNPETKTIHMRILEENGNESRQSWQLIMPE